MPKLLNAEARENYKLFLRYADGLEGEVDLKKTMSRPEYENLRDKDSFNEVTIDELTNDVVWSGCPGLCKNALYEQLKLRVLMKNLNIDINKI